MNKILQKEIMNRSRLLNRCRKEKTEATRSAYKRQKNFCVKLLRKIKKDFYNKLNVKYITENKLFWKIVNLLLQIKLWKMKGTSGAVLTDPSKAFDCLPYDLLIAKLHVSGIKKESLNLLFSLENKEFVLITLTVNG